jgi:hypothetical protein
LRHHSSLCAEHRAPEKNPQADIFSYRARARQLILRAARCRARRVHETSQKQTRKRTDIMKTTTKNSGIKVNANIKAGGLGSGNHNRSGIKVRAAIKAGEMLQANHNQRPLSAG